MNAAEIMPILQRWADAITAADAALELVQEATGLEPEAPLPTAVYCLQGLADEWAAERVGTAPDWFDWFRLENLMGERAHEAGWPGAMRHVATLEDFAELLAEDVRRAAEIDGRVH